MATERALPGLKQLEGFPGIYVLQVPFAHIGLDHTNCYIIPDDEGILMIDPGVVSPTSFQYVTRAAVHFGFNRHQVRILCTHLHFDHAAMLKRLPQDGGRILMGEEALRNNPWNYYDLRSSLLRSVLQEEGVPPTARKGLAAIASEVRVCDMPGYTYELLSENQILRVGSYEFRVIFTPGHSRGHICLYDKAHGVLISGDHVLEKITPSLTLPFEGDNSVLDYLESLNKVDTPDCNLVLPGHGEPFTGLSERCDDLRQRHIRRLGQVYEVVARNPLVNGYTVMRKMPWKRSGPYDNWALVPPYTQLCMCNQTLSYLDFLRRVGELELIEDREGRHYRIT